MKRSSLLVLLGVLSLSCESGPIEKPAGPSPVLVPSRPAAGHMAASAAATVERPPRVVRFDGGVALIEEAFLSERIEVTRSGRAPSESTCAGPVATYDRLSAFFGRFQSALLADDRKAVVAMVKFPLRVNSRKLPEVASPVELLERWDRVFSSRVKKKIANAEPHDVVCRDGTRAMFGAGVLWADAVDGELRVRVVNR